MCKGGIVLPQPLRGSTYSIQIISHVISRPLVGPPPMCHGIPDGVPSKGRLGVEDLNLGRKVLQSYRKYNCTTTVLSTSLCANARADGRCG